jgi:hypothetical protein
VPHDVRRQAQALKRALTIALAAALVVALAGCAAAPQQAQDAKDPPSRAIQKLLELRLARSKDASAYGLFFKTDPIPKSLAAAASKEATATKPPIPSWQTPYVSRLTTSAADVVVVWNADTGFGGHSPATVFGVEFWHKRWVVVDAKDITDKAKIPPALKR